MYKNVHLQMNIKGELEYTMRMGTWQFEAGNLILGEVGQQGCKFGGSWENSCEIGGREEGEFTPRCPSPASPRIHHSPYLQAA